MKSRRQAWRRTTGRTRTLTFAALPILALAAMTGCKALKPDVARARQADSTIAAQAKGGNPEAGGRCRVSGCNREICSDGIVITPCIWKAEYACYKTARCEVQADGKCGWTMTPELEACLRNSKELSTGTSRRALKPPPR